ncbi:rhamnolipids biosynthesis 3-oxoacyl-reductase [Cristinia sonorae]|uniref:Rhamnolipids biosynthesis 3-oxoacyl-reductase n=1 Tax=Cristinia sonorae TaxID=1940300 RepID=A0A8K0UTC5_9AGAR|nr:rhamnolipids biosynthesis 3-oxoacyl-reductase [Cristinia sonorae]
MSGEDLKISSLYSVKGKIAVVTGGGSGIGAMIASAYVQNGAKVYIASRKEKQLKEVADALNKLGPGSCHYVVADVSSKAGCDALANAIKEKESKIHILVNNSGATWGAPYSNVPEKEGWDRVMNLNVKGLFYLTVALTPLLEKDSTNLDPASVINISSVASLVAVTEASALAAKGDGLWSYHTSKAAVNHLTAQLAVTLAKKNIHVNAILPGVFPSKMTAFAFSRKDVNMAEGQPTGRLGSAQDMAGLALFLASPASAHITGACIPIDGGTTISRLKSSM